MPFEFWRVLKAKPLRRIERMHNLIRYGEFVGSKVKLPTDHTTPMELDLVGTHEDGLFILELKVKGPAERNAFSELLAYSNYIALAGSERGSSLKSAAGAKTPPRAMMMARLNQ